MRQRRVTSPETSTGAEERMTLAETEAIVNELVAAGLLEECGHVLDHGELVRTCRITEAGVRVVQNEASP